MLLAKLSQTKCNFGNGYHCGKSVQIRSFFWSVWSRIWTEYGEMRSISPYSVRIRKNTDQKNSVFGHFSRSALFFKQRDLMRPVSMIGQKNCWTKKCEIEIVNRKSKLTRISKLEVANEKNFIEIELPHIFPRVYSFQNVTQEDENNHWEYRRKRHEKKEKD